MQDGNKPMKNIEQNGCSERWNIVENPMARFWWDESVFLRCNIGASRQALDEVVACDMYNGRNAHLRRLSRQWVRVCFYEEFYLLFDTQAQYLCRILQYMVYMLFYFCCCILGRIFDAANSDQSMPT